MTTAVAQQGELVILDDTGDTRLIWDADKQDEVDEAKKTFSNLKKKGYVAYAVDRKGEKGRVIDEFDPTAEKIILAPQLQGG